MATVSAITLTRGTACTVFAVFKKVTRATFNPTTGTATLILANPTTVSFIFELQSGGGKTTWVWSTGTTATTHITKLSTGVFVASIPTSKTLTATATTLLGVITGTGAVTVTGQFKITIKTTKV